MPSCCIFIVYGHALTYIYYNLAGKVILTPNQVSALVHVEDLAQAYVLAATTPRARGQIFNLASSNESFVAIAQLAQKIINPAIKIVEEEAKSGTLEEGVGTWQLIDSAKARVIYFCYMFVIRHHISLVFLIYNILWVFYLVDQKLACMLISHREIVVVIVPRNRRHIASIS